MYKLSIWNLWIHKRALPVASASVGWILRVVVVMVVAVSYIVLRCYSYNIQNYVWYQQSVIHCKLNIWKENFYICSYLVFYYLKTEQNWKGLISYLLSLNKPHFQTHLFRRINPNLFCTKKQLVNQNKESRHLDKSDLQWYCPVVTQLRISNVHWVWGGWGGC